MRKKRRIRIEGSQSMTFFMNSISINSMQQKNKRSKKLDFLPGNSRKNTPAILFVKELKTDSFVLNKLI